MSFSADWLTLREPFDAAARDRAEAGVRESGAGDARLLGGLRGALHADSSGLCSIVDLGGGTGANLRWLAPRLGGRQQWRVLDHDAALLAALPGRVAEWAAVHGWRVTQLAGARPAGSTPPSGVALAVWANDDAFEVRINAELIDLAAGIDDLELPRGALVTASALLDLVSAAWFDALALRCRQAQAALLFALNYDGRIDWQAADPDDAAVRAAFNAHQRRDKGFGAALGPAAAAHVERRLRLLGYRVHSAASDWRIGPADEAIAVALLAGWTQAAIEAEPAQRPVFERWQQRRADAIARGTVRLTVGHTDIAAYLPAP